MTNAQIVSLYRTMQIIRQTEEELARCHQRGLIHGACHTYVGQEAIATALRKFYAENHPALAKDRAADVAGRTCQTYGAADTKLTTGQRVDFVFGLDADNLPCFIETQSGTTTLGHDEYSLFNEITVADIPAAGTPVAIPAAMATPVHHD